MSNIPGHKGNTNQMTMRFSLTQVRMAINNNTHTKKQMVDIMPEQRNPYLQKVGMKISVTAM
jgi:hypothetical protein